MSHVFEMDSTYDEPLIIRWTLQIQVAYLTLGSSQFVAEDNLGGGTIDMDHRFSTSQTRHAARLDAWTTEKRMGSATQEG